MDSHMNIHSSIIQVLASAHAQPFLLILLFFFLSKIVFPFIFVSSNFRGFRHGTFASACYVVCIIVICRYIPLDPDEIENLHCSWLVSQGLLPFQDFWQHHLPALWIILSPITRFFASGSILVEAARLSCTFLALLSTYLSWKICQNIHQTPQLSPSAFLGLWALMLIPFQWSYLRPDLIVAPLILSGLSLLIKAPSNSVRNRFLSGLLFGISLSFTPKILLLVCGAVIADMLSTPMGGSWTTLQKAFGTSTGIFCGLAPLSYWLVSHNLMFSCFHDVFLFNRKFQSSYLPGGYLPTFVIIYTIILWWRYRSPLFQRQRQINILAASIFGGSLLILTMPHQGLYHFQLISVLVVILLLPVTRDVIQQFLAGKRYQTLALLSIFLFLPSHYYLRISSNGSFRDNLKQLDTLHNFSQKGPVSLIYPFHPILTRNATGFVHIWFWKFLEIPSLHEDLKRPLGNFLDQLQSSMPVLITSRNIYSDLSPSTNPDVIRKILAEHFFNTGFIDDMEKDRLQAFLDHHYRLARIANDWIWLRNDIPESF